MMQLIYNKLDADAQLAIQLLPALVPIYLVFVVVILRKIWKYPKK